jgi:hypothetical protein
MPLTKITGGEFDNTQGGLSVAGIITASSDLLVSGSTYITGGLGVGTAMPSGKVEIVNSGSHLVLNDNTSTGNGNKTVYINSFKNGVGYHNLSVNGYELIFKSGGAETEYMRLNSAGNFGLGTNNPEGKFTINGGNGQRLIIQNSGMTNNQDYGSIAWKNPSGAILANISLLGNSNSTSDGTCRLSFGTRSNTGQTTLVEQLTLDNSGRVTTPYQPSFQAFSSSNTLIGSGTNVLPFNATNFNVGSHYNTSTYRFTAPVAGVYLFSVNLNLYTAPGIMMPAVRINGSSAYYGSRLSGNISGDNNLNLIVLLSLSVNDYVEALSSAQGSSAYISNGAAWTRFEGRLLG